MDDDLQNPPEEVERLLAFAQRSGKEAIYTYYDDKRHALWRNLGSRFANRVADFVLDKPKGLYLSSFRCMSAFVVREITRYQGPFPYIDGLILQVTHDIDRLLVRHLPRAVGRSNYTLRRLLRLWTSMFVNFSVMPLRLSTLTGFVLSLLGAIGGAMAVAEAVFSSPPPGWASLFAAVLLLSGVQLMILGIVGEYLGRLYLTANGKPQAVVKEVRHSEVGAARAQLRAARARVSRMALYYTSLAVAILFAVVGQIALKVGGRQLGERRRASPQSADDDRACDLSVRRVVLHFRPEKDPGFDRPPIGRGELCAGCRHRPPPVERAARLAASRRHPADRRRRPAAQPALTAKKCGPRR